MNLLTIIILGALQGVLEWLPVSSQGMLTVIMTALGEDPSIALDYSLYLHIGTMLAAIIYYRKEFYEMIKEGKLLKFVIITTFFSGLIGGALYFSVKRISEGIGIRMLGLIGLALIVTGIMQLKKKKGFKELPSNKDAVITGLTQGLSVIPGISRSGITISTLLFRNIKGVSAIKLSFILSVPLVLIANIGLELMDSPSVSWEISYGIVTAFVIGLLTIKALTALAEKINFGKFCIAMGLLTMIPALII
ncbi:MAG TPA: undecaprenyl-diphosphate phosphatase [Candidatus Nanoarchaeia archaeon]|nr:undecaprenyl-diphosphate phosphatase [Candidatus Nanoarchaeia archaeon]